MTKVLMSRDNPEGRKLSELLKDIIDDLKIKNEYISESKHSMRGEIVTSNHKIMINLVDSLLLDDIINEKLDGMEPNKGPEHPRL